jgi:hypothetical protein
VYYPFTSVVPGRRLLSFIHPGVQWVIFPGSDSPQFMYSLEKKPWPRNEGSDIMAHVTERTRDWLLKAPAIARGTCCLGSPASPFLSDNRVLL